MSFNTAETSDYNGQPVELFRFAHGVEVWRYTSGDSPVTTTDGTYTPEAIVADSVARGREFDSGSTKVTVDYLNPVAQLWQGNRPREPVLVTVYGMHRGEADLPVKFNGEVQGARSVGRSVVLSCVPSTYREKRRIPMLRMSTRCVLPLYGERCSVVRESFRLRVTIGGVSGRVLDAASFASQVDGWWVNGYVQTLQGETRDVAAHAGTAITLSYPLEVDPGDVVDIFAGCDRSKATCTDKFSNLVNFLGFHLIPSRNLFGPSIE